MSSVDPLLGTSIGSYKVLSRIGVGGMGAVYIGEHPLIGKRVAIKVLHAEFAEKADIVQRFFQEARAVSLLKHPNIVDCIDFGRVDSATGSLHYAIMELLEGETLRDKMKAAAMAEHDAAKIAQQIADAAGSAHRQQIIHRDLKPENVFLTGEHRDFVKILDFGIAKLTGQGQASMQTQAGTLLGTPSYMSPEQCMARPVDARTDVYALGIILFEMVTGRVPFIGEGYADLLIKQISADAPLIRTINPVLSLSLEQVVAKALQKAPENRFQSMDELQAALQPSLRRATGQVPALTDLVADHSVDATILSTGGGARTPSGAHGPISTSSPQVATRMGQAPNTGGRRTGVIVGVAAAVVILAAGGLGAAVYFGDQQPKTPLTTPQNQPPPTAADPGVSPTVAKVEKKVMRLHVTSEPAGAEVKKEDGTVLGQTPLDTELPADGSMVKISVRKEGFKEEVRAVIVSERDKTLAFTLVSETPHVKPNSVDGPIKPSGAKKTKRPRKLGDDILTPNL